MVATSNRLLCYSNKLNLSLFPVPRCSDCNGQLANSRRSKDNYVEGDSISGGEVIECLYNRVVVANDNGNDKRQATSSWEGFLE